MTAKQWGRIRKSLGWTQERLAKELGMGRSTITKYENGTDPIPLRSATSLRNFVKLKELAA